MAQVFVKKKKGIYVPYNSNRWKQRLNYQLPEKNHFRKLFSQELVITQKLLNLQCPVFTKRSYILKGFQEEVFQEVFKVYDSYVKKRAKKGTGLILVSAENLLRVQR